MGIFIDCCDHETNSEAYLKSILDTKCIVSLNYGALVNIVASYFKSAEDHTRRSKSITEEIYLKVVDDVIHCRYHVSFKEESDEEEIIFSKKQENELQNLQKLLKNLYSIFDINHTFNYSLFKLVWIPILSDPIEKKKQLLFECLKEAEITRIQNSIEDPNTISFSRFAENFLFYLVSALSGYSIALERILPSNGNDDIVSDLKSNLSDSFVPIKIKKYYANLVNNTAKEFDYQSIGKSRHAILSQYEMTYQDYLTIIDNSPQIFSLMKLREDFLLFLQNEEQKKKDGIFFAANKYI